MLCKLCCEQCLDFEDLYDKNDQANYIYKICQKFFFREMEKLGRTRVKCSKIICSICWKTISKFNDFYEKIVAKQTDYWDLITASKSLVVPEDTKTFIMNDVEGMESEFIVKIEDLRESPVNRTRETTIQKEPSGYGSVISNCDSVEIKVEEEFMDEENELGEDEASQSLSYSYLAGLAAEGIDNKSQNQERESNHSSLDEFQKKRIPENESGVVKNVKDEEWRPIIRCDLCYYSSDIYMMFISHYRESHPNNLNSLKFQKPFQCERCFSSHATKARLKAHLLCYHQECLQSRKDFRDKRHLNFKGEHTNSKKTCDLRGAQLSKSLNSTNHMNSQTTNCLQNSEETLLGSQQYRQDLSSYECQEKHMKDGDVESANESFTQTKDRNYSRGLQSDVILNNGPRKESLFNRFKRCDPVYDSSKNETSLPAAKVPIDSLKYSSKMSDLNEVIEIKDEEEFIDDDGENEFHEFQSVSQSPSNSSSFKQNTEISDNESEELEVSIFCNINEVQKKRIQEIENDMLNGKWIVTFRCDLCEYSTELRTEFLHHYRKEHEENLNSEKLDKPYECEICYKLFTGRSVLRNHFSTHLALLRRYKCSKCHKRFDSKKSANLHQISSHRSNTKRIWECDMCGKQISTKKNLMAHKRRNICRTRVWKQKKVSRDQNYLYVSNPDPSLGGKSNEVINENEDSAWKPIIRCDLCEYSFESCTMFISHYKKAHPNNLNSHKFQKPFQCETCFWSYATKEKLKKHLNTHRKYPQCGEKFVDKNRDRERLIQKSQTKLQYQRFSL